MKGVNEYGGNEKVLVTICYEAAAGMSWILLYKSIVEAKYCDRFTRWLSSFISHQIQCNMVYTGHLL